MEARDVLDILDVLAALQVAHHSGYEPRRRDRHDMDLLQAQFRVSPPFGYR